MASVRPAWSTKWIWNQAGECSETVSKNKDLSSNSLGLLTGGPLLFPFSVVWFRVAQGLTWRGKAFTCLIHSSKLGGRGQPMLGHTFTPVWFTEHSQGHTEKPCLKKKEGKAEYRPLILASARQRQTELWVQRHLYGSSGEQLRS